MRNKSFALFALLPIFFAITLIQIEIPITTELSQHGKGLATARIDEAYGALPLSFEANRGQTAPEVKYLSRGGGYSLFLTANEAVLELNPSRDRKGAVPQPRLQGKSGPLASARGSDQASASAVLRMKLLGANSTTKIAGAEELPGHSNYLIGSDPTNWHTDVPTYAKVRYSGVYPGIDLVYYGNHRQLEYDFVVAPGSQPGAIRLGFEGAGKIEVSAEGDLIAHVEGEEVRLRKPVIYQQVGGARKEVSGGYVVDAANRVGFQVGSYDTTKTLVIDPTLIYNTQLAGSSNDVAGGIAVDASGSAYIIGITSSADYPTTPSGAKSICASTPGGSCPSLPQAFVTKLDASGASVVYSSFLGITASPTASAIAVDASGNAYAATGGSVVKLNPTGNSLVYSFSLASTGTSINSVAVDGAGNAYLTGQTSNSAFPTTPGAFATRMTGNAAFVSKLNSSGFTLIYSGLLSGSGSQTGNAIAIDASGNAYVTGVTSSPDFPQVSAAQSTMAGGAAGDAFAAKIDSSGARIVFSTFLGGKGDDAGAAIAVDGSGSAYLTGSTSSTDFPTSLVAFKRTCGTDANCNPTPSGASPDAFVAGNGSSDFPIISGAIQSAGGNGFLTELNTDGASLVYSTFIGRAGTVAGLALDSAGSGYVTGTYTASPGLFAQVQHSFVSKIGTSNSVPVIGSLSPASAIAGGSGFVLTLNGSNFVAGAVVRWNGSDRPTTFVSSNQLTASITASDIAAVGTAQVAVFNPLPQGGLSNSLIFSIQASGSNPVPSIGSLSPSDALVGGAGFTLTVNGVNFASGSTVQWNGSSRATTLVSSAQLRASIASGDIASPGTAQVTVLTPSPGGGTSNGVTFTINNPAPVLTDLSPQTAQSGGAAFTLSVSGSGFLSTSVIRWNGNSRATTFVSATSLRASIPASDIASAGTAQVTVFNPSPGGGTSASLTFSINPPTNPVPFIDLLLPSGVVAGGNGVTLTVNGSNFVRGAVVRWNGSDRSTTFSSGTSVQAAISAADIASSGTVAITVFNPPPGGGSSNTLTFTINPAGTNPVPTLSGITPSSAVAGGAAFTLTVTGTSFISGAVVRWNGSNRNTTFVNDTRLTAAIAPSDILAQGTSQVTVFNPAPGGGSSNALNFTVQPNPTGPLPNVELTVWRPGDGTWYIVTSSNLFLPSTRQWGTTGDIPIPGDYDGDHKTDVAVWRPSNGTWYVIRSSIPDSNSPLTGQWGTVGDVPVPSDYDGDGKTDFAVWRPSEGNWYIVLSGSPFVSSTRQWGTAGDIPVPGDYDGDGKADLAVFRPSVGVWFIIRSSIAGSTAAPTATQWGTAGDIPVAGDYDGDGKTDFAVWRPSNGTWYILRSSNPDPNQPVQRQWGTAGDIPVAGDFDGDGKADFAIFRPSEGTWYIIPSSNTNRVIIVQWGTAGDVPLFTITNGR